MILISLVFCLTANNCCVSSDSNALAKELKTIEKGIPLPYHQDLALFVDKHEKKALPETFLDCETFIELGLRDRKMPTELKYLPVALTEMRTDYQQNDRYGIWALPTLVALHYGLAIDESQDERFSVGASTKVALDYLADLYAKYGDWWQAILAYSNSPNALQHAASRSNSPLEVWDYYDQQLIPNTSIICDFIACVVVYHDHERRASGVGFVSDEQAPVAKKAAIALPTEKKEEPKTVVTQQEEPQPTTPEIPRNAKVIKYKVKKGDTLSHIAKKYHVTISDLVEWNHLETDLIRDGQELIIIKEKKP